MTGYTLLWKRKGKFLLSGISQNTVLKEVEVFLRNSRLFLMQWICVTPSEKSTRSKMKILLLSLKKVSSQGEMRPGEEN